MLSGADGVEVGEGTWDIAGARNVKCVGSAIGQARQSIHVGSGGEGAVGAGQDDRAGISARKAAAKALRDLKQDVTHAATSCASRLRRTATKASGCSMGTW